MSIVTEIQEEKKRIQQQIDSLEKIANGEIPAEIDVIILGQLLEQLRHQLLVIQSIAPDVNQNIVPANQANVPANQAPAIQAPANRVRAARAAMRAAGAGANQDNVPALNVEKPYTICTVRELACHTFALSGDRSKAAEIHKRFTELADQQGGKYNYGVGLSPDARQRARNETVNLVKREIRDQEKSANLQAEVYLCAGFREGQVAPEHMWLEDRTNRITFDTFIYRDIVNLNTIGKDFRSFAPGCEGNKFRAEEIVRVRVNGYTESQLELVQEMLTQQAQQPNPRRGGRPF